MRKRVNVSPFLDGFVLSLKKQNTDLSPVTLKNYRADVGQFIRWFSGVTTGEFDPLMVTPGHIEYYKGASGLSNRSLQRHLSSLKKFFLFLSPQGLLSESLFAAMQKEESQETKHVNAFAFYLYVERSSQLTVKQYRIDVNGFLEWAKKKLGFTEPIWDKNIFSCIDNKMVDEYLVYLVEEKSVSVSTIHRKRAALNRYLAWLQTTT